ncbi:MAG: sensor histidine kinase [Lachnospiraceae bacterium]|nr:sensor histidine kinase [Lachnospiraceae bacterium]
MMKNFKAYIIEKIRWLAVILCIALVMTVTMLLNGIPFHEIGYGMLLCLFVTAVAVFTGYGRHGECFRQLEQMQKNIIVAPDEMKVPEYMYERQYQDCIRSIAQEKDRIQNELVNRQQDLSEYYSMWVHQIKTPIAALKLLIDADMNACLDADDAEENDICVTNIRQKQNELFRIEQYVDMALQYTRLGAQTNDFVIERVLLDEVIKLSIHKYAKQFIHKQLQLTYVPQDIKAVTDQKWLGFVIDQLLSNAIKYTKEGGITIQVIHTTPSETDNLNLETAGIQKHWHDKKQDETIHIIIEDTGIGISAEDLPRVCEKGYTGYNGHADQYSTGIGLYLCKAILDKLGHPFVISSEKGKGTKVEILFLADKYNETVKIK